LPELVHSEVPAHQKQRLARLMMDVLRLREQLTRAQIRSVYPELEAARDALSNLLDKADGKNA
jgi:hypothetical protein